MTVGIADREAFLPFLPGRSKNQPSIWTLLSLLREKSATLVPARVETSDHSTRLGQSRQDVAAHERSERRAAACALPLDHRRASIHDRGPGRLSVSVPCPQCGARAFRIRELETRVAELTVAMRAIYSIPT